MSPYRGPGVLADPDELLRMRIRAEHDVFAVRQRGREVAAVVGLDRQDQVRVATALSEVGRLMLMGTGGATVIFDLVDDGAPALRVRAEATDPSGADLDDLASLMAPVARLVDELTLQTPPDPVRVVILRRFPPGMRRLPRGRVAEIRAALESRAPAGPLDELAAQNEQLLATLEQVQQQRDELLRLNGELEETNRGVMALYGQLSSELEETNRGVVALYAELDERSAQLREASEAKTRFLANASHELRAPVTSIIGLARLLGTGDGPLTPDQAEQIELIDNSATDLLRVVNDLLDLAKAESGRIEPQWEKVALAEVFAQLRAVISGLGQRPDVDLVVDDPVGVPPLLTDPVLLTQVLRNLVTNALKFTEHGAVRLSATCRDGDRVTVSVQDTGIGIPEDQQQRIFEEFYQVPGARPVGQPGARGTGLGLPYARRLALLLGGDLRVRSRVGQGSTFTVELPLRTGSRQGVR
ncbi:MAG TPA: ATP-binding protein [Micromonosporaceae bacterium]